MHKQRYDAASLVAAAWHGRTLRRTLKVLTGQLNAVYMEFILPWILQKRYFTRASIMGEKEYSALLPPVCLIPQSIH